jgi:membrane protease YdiL (CAAX protease family)
LDLEHVGAAGWYHLAIFGFLLPWAALRSRRRVGLAPLPTLRRHLPRTVVQLILLGALSAGVAGLEWVPLFPRRLPPLWTVALGLALAVGAAMAMRPLWRRSVAERKRLTYLFMPRTRSERAWWIVTSLAAGISEEISWRGVQWVLLTRLLGSVWIAAALCVAMFAVAHAVQGGRTVAIIVAFAAAFHALVALSGSLYVAMAAHTLYDVLAGLNYGRLGERLGYPRDPAELGPSGSPS